MSHQINKGISSPQFPSISYRREGSGPTIILLHGFPFDSSIWAKAATLLAQNFTVISLDIPGFGASERKAASMSFQELSLCIDDVIAAEKIDSYLLVGHSMGGYLALSFTSRHTKGLKGLAMVHSVATADSEEKKENRKRVMATLQNGGRELYLKESITQCFAKEFRQNHSNMVRDTIALGKQTKDENLIATIEAMMNRDEHLTMLENLDIPIQWIAGKHDELMPYEKILDQAYLAPRNFVTVLEQSGHMSMLEQPDALASSIQKFAAYCFSSSPMFYE